MSEPRLSLAACFCALLIAGSATAQTPVSGEQCSPSLVADMPLRPSGSVTGEAFADQIDGISGETRETAVAAQITSGNMPTFLRELRPVVLGGGSEGPEIVVCVTPDYVAVGADSDFLRVPMALPTALSLAKRFGFVLPTRKIVDAIYAQADVKLAPSPMPPTAEMVTTSYFRRHNQIVDAQRQTRGSPLGALTAGQKKDLVLTTRLWRNPGRVAIYGWHQTSGKAIQPLSTVHGADYADYSHGVRLVSTTVTVDGEPRSIFDVLSDARLANVLSDEGPMPRLAELVAELGGPPAQKLETRVASR